MIRLLLVKSLFAEQHGCSTAIKTNVTMLVSEAFRIQQVKERNEAQATRADDRAVREALLAHADLPVQKSILSAGEWLHLIPILAQVMPAFWYGVVLGIWGSIKVISYTKGILSIQQ